MSIISVSRVWHGETWSDEQDGTREFEEFYRVISDDPEESSYDVRFNAGLPVPWAAYPEDDRAICTGRSCRRPEASRLIWEVTLRYSWSPEDDEDDENPLNKEPEIEWDSSSFTKAIIKDRDGNAITNSAGDYPDPPPEDEIIRWNILLQCNVPFVPAFIRQYAGAINESTIEIDGESIAAERARIVGMKISRWQTENDVDFRTVTLNIEARDDSDDDYDLEMLDQGFRYKDGTELKDILIEDEDGTKHRPSAPILLDGNGEKLIDPSPTTAVFLIYPTKRLMDFTIFPGIS